MVFEDQTKMRESESVLRESRDRAEAGDRAKSQFFAHNQPRGAHSAEWHSGFHQSAARDAAQCGATRMHGDHSLEWRSAHPING